MLSLGSFAWGFCTVWVAAGAFAFAFKSFAPDIILRLYVYGKIKSEKHASEKKSAKFYLPKSYFSHFYFGGVIAISYALGQSLYVLCGGGQWPEFVKTVVTWMRYPVEESYGDMYSCLIVLVCADIQVIRRFSECLLVSVYSPGSKMSFVIYLVGIGFYTFLPVTAISGSKYTAEFKCGDFLDHLTKNHVAGVLLFLWASWQQRRTAFTFAKLRQNKSGSVENMRHHIPRGGLFEYVSCPHYFAEILIYLSMNIIFNFENTMMISMLVFVAANQLISGYFSHAWYKEKFPKYPKNRKSTIPFIF